MWQKAMMTAVAVMAAVLAVPAHAADNDPTWDGLQRVKSKKVDELYLLPGADFREYTKVILDPIQVSFRKDWRKDMNRGSLGARPRVSAEDAERIRRTMSEGFEGILAGRFTQAGYEIVVAPGPDVLRVTPVLLDVYVNAPDTMQVGRVESYTMEAGEATLALEVRDAETNQLLGRTVDERRTGETGRLTWTTSVSNRFEFERLFRNWSSTLVDGMAALKASSPIKVPERQ